MFQSLHYPKRQVTHVYNHREICQYEQTNRPSQVWLHRQFRSLPKTLWCLIWLRPMCRRGTRFVLSAYDSLYFAQLVLNLLLRFKILLIVHFLIYLKSVVWFFFFVSKGFVRGLFWKIVEKVPFLEVLSFEVEKVKHRNDKCNDAWENAG